MSSSQSVYKKITATFNTAESDKWSVKKWAMDIANKTKKSPVVGGIADECCDGHVRFDTAPFIFKAGELPKPYSTPPATDPWDIMVAEKEAADQRPLLERMENALVNGLAAWRDVFRDPSKKSRQTVCECLVDAESIMDDCLDMLQTLKMQAGEEGEEEDVGCYA